MPEPSTSRDLRLDFFRGVSLIWTFIDFILSEYDSVISEYDSVIVMQLAINAAGIGAMLLTAAMIDWYKAMDRMPMPQPAQQRRGEEVAR